MFTSIFLSFLLQASIATRVSSAIVIIASFLDSQLAFCSMQSIPKQEKRKIRGSHEQVSDIEYIIPRVSITYAIYSFVVPTTLITT